MTKNFKALRERHFTRHATVGLIYFECATIGRVDRKVVPPKFV
jgi:hypothetical protein